MQVYADCRLAGEFVAEDIVLAALERSIAVA